MEESTGGHQSKAAFSSPLDPRRTLGMSGATLNYKVLSGSRPKVCTSILIESRTYQLAGRYLRDRDTGPRIPARMTRGDPRNSYHRERDDYHVRFS